MKPIFVWGVCMKTDKGLTQPHDVFMLEADARVYKHKREEAEAEARERGFPARSFVIIKYKLQETKQCR